MATETEELDAGSVIGNYRVVRLLGQGGMGTVYEVEHLELGTHYALKTFTFDPENAASQALKAKFLEEGKLLARLKHPNLTHVFDLGFEEKTQMPYFVMDLVMYEDGETYTVEDIDLGDIDEELVYKWFGQLASALDYIHGEGIVHRDIKPSNLLVDADLNVVLTDFGISRIFGEKIKAEVDATQTMVAKTGRGKLVLGTEHYIAPEVAKGEEATPRADAYSLGVMLLRWLTGFYYGDNPGAIAMLSGKKYRWLGVIAKLVAPAGRRPENYTELVKLLKVNVQAKPEETERRKRARKKRNAIQNLIAVALGLAIAVGIAAGGYCLWRHFERLNVERDQKFAALQRQIREKDEAEARAKTEAEAAQKAKAAEESRLAGEKRRAREAKPAPTLVETPQETLPAARDRRDEKPAAEKAVERDAQENRPKIAAEADAPAPVDYGPIPNVRYLWHDKRDETKPLQVRFQLANGATVDLMPMKKGSFFMSNCPRDVKSYHKVTFSYDYWMSKHLVTADQWRDFGPFDCEDCRPIEKLVPTNYPVCKGFPFHSITSYCHYLTQRYKAQLPEGYEFRLPTEAELEYAAVGPFVMHDMYDDQYRSEGVFACGNFSTLKSSKGLDVLGKWNPNGLLAIKGSMVHVRGLAKKFPTGVFDCWFDAAPVIDEWLGKDFDFCVNYEDAEDDPLHIRGDGNSSLRSLRLDAISRWAMDFFDVNFRIVLAIRRDLLKIYKENRIIQVETKKIPERKYDWAVPHKLSHPKELKFKLANGAEMVFCACPAGKFVMSNVRGQAKNGHQVTITRPFWMTKYFVTAEQWRDFSKYDCEGLCRKIEKAFSKYPVSCAFIRFRWMAFCDYLTKVYGAQLPKGYVFRLPTEAEWEYAFTGGDGFSLMKKNSLYGSASGAGAGRFMDIVRNLQRKEKWIKDLNWTNGNDESRLDKIYIGGWSAPHAWGIYDLSTWSNHVLLDTLVPLSSTDWRDDPCQALNYADREIDPLRWAGTKEKVRCVFRNANDNRGVRNDDFAFAHIVVGPDLIAEKNAAKGVGGENASDGGLPIVASKDIPKPMSLELRKDNVIDFVGCPKGEFVMGQKLEGVQANNRAYKPHRVTITRPYWLSKFKVTQRQWNIYKQSPMTKYDEAMGGLDVPFHRGAHYQEVLNYCEFLTKRFRAKLPKGYVIRLPTEAEWEFALRVRDTSPESKYANFKENGSLVAVQRRDVLLRAENARLDLSGFKDYEYAPIAVGTKLPNGLGLFDMIGNGFEMMLDTIRDDGTIKVSRPLEEIVAQTALTYDDKEVDPLKTEHLGLVVVRGAAYNNMEGDPWCKRVVDTTRSLGTDIQSVCIRLCIGPNLMKEKGAGKAMKKNRGGKK